MPKNAKLNGLVMGLVFGFGSTGLMALFNALLKREHEPMFYIFMIAFTGLAFGYFSYLGAKKKNEKADK